MAGKETGITELLAKYQAGDREAMNELMPLVHGHLSKIARSLLRGRLQGKSLVPTVLVNECFVRLVENEALVLRDRVHFFSVAARCMRFILADYARARTAKKRGGEWECVTFQEGEHGEENRTIDLISLNDALTRLEKKYPEVVRVVEMRYLAGLTIEETAAALGLTTAAVRSQWNLAKAWLARELAEKKAA